jgi:glycosyltransferase involved in cell wall biosynthesis
VEHVIVDGGSTDGTVDLLRSHGELNGCWISEPDSGIYNALNKGLGLARGDYYIPLGCDDALLPTAVHDLVASVGAYLIVMGKVACVDRSGGQRLIRNHSAGTLISVNAHAKLGLYDESYRIAADTKFLQFAEQRGYIKRIDSVVGEFVLGGASSNYAKNIVEHARAMQEAGSWSILRSKLWIAPRLIYAMVRR